MRRANWIAVAALLVVACGSDAVPSGGDGGPEMNAAVDGSVRASDGGGRDADAGGAGGSRASDAAGAGGASGAGGSSGAGGASDGAAGSGGNDGATGSGDANDSGGSSGDDGSSGTRTYTTHFSLTENPISEGGNWINGQTTGLDWHDVSTTPGLAIGHQSGSSYTDGTALLTGTWGPTQTVEAVVHAKNQKDSCYQEVEMRLRSSLSAHSCTGYEISFKASTTSGAYLIIVRWNGPVGDFTYLNQYNGAQYGVSEGDTVKATIAGNVITAYLNGVQMGTAMDDTYQDGSPGMGFNLETGDSSCIGTNGDYGFTSLTATGQ